ncbi:hypothetical protein ON010_g8940 [Phytophthora cinnamomi]|nr:hypothetical protein ON010_g8940 [Phytophthora cinnamomi]
MESHIEEQNLSANVQTNEAPGYTVEASKPVQHMEITALKISFSIFFLRSRRHSRLRSTSITPCSLTDEIDPHSEDSVYRVLVKLLQRDVEDRKSVSGVIVQVKVITVDWQSKKQTAAALSTAEAEFVAVSVERQAVLWLHELFTEIGVSVELLSAMKMNSQATAKQITNEVS